MICAQGDRRAIRVSEEAGRLVDRVHDRGHILELTLDRVFHSIAALTAATAVERVDAKAIDEGGDDKPEAPVGARRPVDEDERRPLAAPPVPDPRSVARPHMLEDRGSFSHGWDSKRLKSLFTVGGRWLHKCSISQDAIPDEKRASHSSRPRLRAMSRFRSGEGLSREPRRAT